MGTPCYHCQQCYLFLAVRYSFLLSMGTLYSWLLFTLCLLLMAIINSMLLTSLFIADAHPMLISDRYYLFITVRYHPCILLMSTHYLWLLLTVTVLLFLLPLQMKHHLAGGAMVTISLKATSKLHHVSDW